MSKIYQVTPMVRLVNRLMSSLVRLNIAPTRTHVLTVTGRKSGRNYSTPVTLVEEGAKRWLVAPYGEVNWVRNVRAAGHVTLTRAGKSESRSVIEIAPSERAVILKKYVALEPITRPYFDAAPDAPIEAFAAEAARHPVFEIV
ncbi:MAG: nitroreductase family deazaflavin-dependent oxidoreductase [Chloroflexi bacterium]|nr:nitroreductase family deazaflavin-dependent oxidoreductase [Chloroflexota bacterium]